MDASDKLYPLAELGDRAWMPRRKSKKGVNSFTVLRWALHGKSSVKLKSLMVGGIRCTCDRWAMEFFESVTFACDNSPRPKVNDGDHARAERELEAAGI